MSVQPGSSAAPIRSMTGYALMRAATAAGELTVSLKTVNHRGLDLHFHGSGELARFENAMRAVLKQNVARGHLEVRVSLARNAAAQAAGYNRDLVARYVELFRQARNEFGLTGEPDLNVAFTLPGVFDAGPEATPVDGALEAEIVVALTACVRELNAYREREGAELVAGLEAEIASIEQRTREIAAIRSRAAEALYRRLRERLAELLSDSALSQSRLAEEAALLADKSDVQEELTRLEVHTQELRRIFASGGEVGKRLDFLLQEMNRETNTVLSKTSGAGEIGLTVTNLALAVKANIERIREQALNLE
ncbi:MAG TPA: YicC/YloC family endoribonuclease [Bryobacteraceae bacterium]|jgi:uncharacterized protein (TIGR00255 family)|nr:YicC/YloC family endoribonuclease [Bryobacteraceae bacterium]